MTIGFSLSTLLASIVIVAGVGWFALTALKRVLGIRPGRRWKDEERRDE